MCQNETERGYAARAGPVFNKPSTKRTRRRPKRVALYLRVSTSEQTTRNQRRELKAVADRHGWEVVKVFEDAGFSGGKGREDHPGVDERPWRVVRWSAWTYRLTHRVGPRKVQRDYASGAV